MNELEDNGEILRGDKAFGFIPSLVLGYVDAFKYPNHSITF
jgi:hypothetical protein